MPRERNGDAVSNQGLRFFTGSAMDPAAKRIEDSEIRAVAPDGRTGFTIRLVGGQPTIEISTWVTFKMNDVLYDSQLIVEPMASNRVCVTAKEYPQ